MAGKVPEALCGFGDYFIPDATYRNHHDAVLAVAELLEWSKEGNGKMAADGFERAIEILTENRALESALLLLRSYGLLVAENGTLLPLDEERMLCLIADAARESGAELASKEELRRLLLLVTQQFPSLKTRIGMP